MQQVPIFILSAVLITTVGALGERTESSTAVSAAQSPTSQQPPAPRVVDLKASYFAATKPSTGVLLLHQSNRTRDSWDGGGRQLAAAGINTLTLDMRGFGESSGTPSVKLTDAERAKIHAMRPGDVETAFQYLVSQPGVKRDFIGVGGAGDSCGRHHNCPNCSSWPTTTNTLPR
jgi:hypothetical protein